MLRSELSRTHYRLVLPTENQLRREIERERSLAVHEQGARYGGTEELGVVARRGAKMRRG